MPYLHLLKENFMQLKQFLKVNLKRKNRQKILTVSYAVAVVFAFDFICRYGTGTAMYCAD